MAAAGLLLLLSTTSSVGEGAAAAAAEPWAPLSWATAGSRLYSFCSNSSGALSPAAVSALGRSAFMIHGMECGAALAPVWQNSEMKTGLAAKQLRAVNPSQLQLYTVQIDYARSVCALPSWPPILAASLPSPRVPEPPSP